MDFPLTLTDIWKKLFLFSNRFQSLFPKSLPPWGHNFPITRLQSHLCTFVKNFNKDLLMLEMIKLPTISESWRQTRLEKLNQNSISTCLAQLDKTWWIWKCLFYCSNIPPLKQSWRHWYWNYSSKNAKPFQGTLQFENKNKEILCNKSEDCACWFVKCFLSQFFQHCHA